MRCLTCGIKLKKNKTFCSKECSNEHRRCEKIERDIRKNEYLLKYELVDFIKLLINEKTGKFEPNKMKPQYFNNHYILPQYFKILEETKKYKTLTFKERANICLFKMRGDKTIEEFVDEIVKNNGGIDFNKIQLRWMELHGFLNISKIILGIDRNDLEEYLFLIKNKKKCCLTCGKTTTFNGYSKGYTDYCSIKCVSNNIEIKKQKQIINNNKKISTIFSLKHITPLFDKSEYKGANQGIKYTFNCDRCHITFESRISNGHLPLCPKCDYRHFSGNSNMENDLISILEQTHYLEKSDRTILDGKELDIYIPSKQIAIEFNGIYWHSELNGKDKKYHLNKTLKCNEKGIQLIHVFENEWIKNKDIVLSIIYSKFGVFNKRIFARKCYVKEITSQEKDCFLESHHIQGKDKSTIKLGLFYQHELVSIMTFGKSRYNKKYQYEMHRFCTKKGHQIVGGASKLWVYFVRNFNPESVVTYADRRYSSGKLYETLDFVKVGVSSQNHFYFKKGHETTLYSRIKFQKHKLGNMFDNFDHSMTSWENMQNNGYDRIWDCGNYVFGWETKK